MVVARKFWVPHRLAKSSQSPNMRRTLRRGVQKFGWGDPWICGMSSATGPFIPSKLDEVLTNGGLSSASVRWQAW